MTSEEFTNRLPLFANDPLPIKPPFAFKGLSAIELGKRFGGTDGHKYVNGILDKLAQNVRADEVAAPRRKRT